MSSGPKCLLTVFHGEQVLGGISSYDAAETTSECPERVALMRETILVYLRTTLPPGESSWEDVTKALVDGANPKVPIGHK